MSSVEVNPGSETWTAAKVGVLVFLAAAVVALLHGRTKAAVVMYALAIVSVVLMAPSAGGSR